MNPTAGQVATEFRRIARALDKEPDTEVAPAWVTFHCNSYDAADKGKQVFLNVVRLLPRPLAKKPSETSMDVENPNKAVVHLRACIDRATVCELIEPAKPAVYHCVPLLSDQEEAELGKF